MVVGGGKERGICDNAINASDGPFERLLTIFSSARGIGIGIGIGENSAQLVNIQILARARLVLTRSLSSPIIQKSFLNKI